jgi:hypothetical protein
MREGKSTQRLKIVGEDGGAIKVDIADNFKSLRGLAFGCFSEFYRLEVF